MCLTQKSYDPFVHYKHLSRMMVKKIPKVLEYYDANKDILSDNEGQYLEQMDIFKEDYNDSKRWAESEKNNWKITMNFEEAVERMDEDIDDLNMWYRNCVEMVDQTIFEVAKKRCIE